MPQLVSILIPAYKAERLVADTIRSACAQTWPNKEIIVVDDGSPDRTLEVAKAFESPCVKVVRQDNAGAPVARNSAFALAQGEYVQWLDADDLLHPDKIRRQMDGAGDGLTSKTLLTGAWGKFFVRTDRATFEPDALWQDRDPVDWIATRFECNVWMNPAVWLVSRWLTERAGPWDARLAKSGDDDGEYICRVVAGSDGVRFVREAVSFYRIGTVGSLNWNMETSEQALDSLVLSLLTTVRHLLALEDSPRTRAAAARHLQAFTSYFYGAEDRHFAELAAAAADIGHTLDPPSVSWKYLPLQAVAGRRVTRKVIARWRAGKLLALRRIEEMRSARSPWETS